MEVILLTDVDHVGLRGDVVSVARGYARNYLLPRRLAEEATPARVAELQKRETQRARHEAKTFEEAQAKFDALDLKIEGILWSPEGSLAVINGEPRARAVNERVKDCVIINIDTNRVDFLFHYNRRRFEFQRYVGEDAKASAKKDDAR